MNCHPTYNKNAHGKFRRKKIPSKKQGFLFFQKWKKKSGYSLFFKWKPEFKKQFTQIHSKFELNTPAGGGKFDSLQPRITRDFVKK